LDKFYNEHVTKQGERWDQIAVEHYGPDLNSFAHSIALIIEANRALFNYIDPIPNSLPFGLTLRIPILNKADIDQSLLPPWKRK
jgi:hypothetical protein